MERDWLHLGPLQWIRYVNKQVNVKAGKDDVTRGWLLTVDPVSASLVLVTFPEVGGASVQVVMGHAVQEVEVLHEADREMEERLRSLLLPPPTRNLKPEERKRRREDVCRWLVENRVPVQEEGEELTVAGVLTISAPYGPTDCSSSNQIILDRIQRLLQNSQYLDTEHL